MSSNQQSDLGSMRYEARLIEKSERVMGVERIRQFGTRLGGTYWFVPSAMVVIVAAVALVLPWVDRHTGPVITMPGWVYGGDPQGARSLLSTIAGSMITVAALTFSITIVALTTASQQFGPQLLRNFIRDRGYQVVLGTFLAAFTYCLLVLLAVEEEAPIPRISLQVAVVLAVAGVGMLVYFIHHVTFSLRAENVVASTGRELKLAIDRLYPERDGSGPKKRRENGRSLPEDFPSGARSVPPAHSGYIQSIDYERLVDLAKDNRIIIRLEHRVSHFVTEEGVLFQVWPDSALDEDVLKDLGECFVLGPQRPLAPDAESAIEELVALSLRALSPSINDPDTAILCIDQLADALARAAERDIPPALLPSEGDVSVVTYPLTFVHMVDLAISRIREYGRGSVPITVRLLESIAAVGTHVQSESARAALLRQADMLKRSSDEAIPEPEDRRVIDLRYRAAEKALNGIQPQRAD
jgi:uncharacterized membrane protein